MKRLEAIKNFLEQRLRGDLLPLIENLEEMEIQVNVAQGNGIKFTAETKEGYKWWGYRDDKTGEIWKPFRIPYGAKTAPFYEDKPLTYDTKYFQAIGLTGWNWKRLQSEWVGFDFDSIANHSKGLTDVELQSIRTGIESIPWVSVRRSTSGKGLHLYVYFDPPIPTNTHTEHAALARSILGILSIQSGAKLESTVDTCGGILWVWHEKQVDSGFELLKPGIQLTEVPNNWQSHIEVISQKRQKIKPIVKEEDESDFEAVVNKTKTVALDDDHKRLIGWLATSNCLWEWDQDRSLLRCHTFDLQTAHKELGFKGPFYTIAQGKDKGNDQNCFGFPIRNGGWIFRRHTRRTPEHPCWQIDNGGWTRCYFNCIADLATAIRCQGGAERSDGWFQVSTLDSAFKALFDLGAVIPETPQYLLSRPAVIREHKDGRIVIKIQRVVSDTQPLGWAESKNLKEWELFLGIQQEKIDVDTPDEFVRHVILGETDAGWYLYTRGMWLRENESNIKRAMLASNVPYKEINNLMGMCALNPWFLVVEPFKSEYPGNRKWNRNSPQFAFIPQEGEWPTWQLILNHCGRELDEAVQHSDWCRDNEITTGGQYLFLWIASVFQFPYEPLPYLFLYGEENSGKSIFHEALSMLFKNKHGYTRADNALLSRSRFNGELTNSVICVVEETDLGKNREALNRIKDWVTGKTISIHTKMYTPYDVLNTTHWIQCANAVDFCPIFYGDTRITVIHVSKPEKEIPKIELLKSLEIEAPAFLHSIINQEIPVCNKRLRVPVITSSEKVEQETINQGLVRVFMKTKTYPCPGNAVSLQELYDSYLSFLPIDQRKEWSFRRFGAQIPLDYVKGKWHGQFYHVANISLDPAAKPIGLPLKRVYDRLVEDNV